jgi:hypothetical protein
MQIELDLPLGILRFDYPLASDKLNWLRIVGNRFDDARQNARGRRWFANDLRFCGLDEGGGLIRRRGKQAPWRKLMPLALSARFPDLDRKGLLLTLHLINDCKLEMTLIWALDGE